MRAHQLSSKLIDLTHDTVPEKKWRPITKVFDRVPPQPILEDKILLREWEQKQQDEHYDFIYDRRKIDGEVFKKLYDQGEHIKMMPNYKELNQDKGFWKLE